MAREIPTPRVVEGPVPIMVPAIKPLALSLIIIPIFLKLPLPLLLIFPVVIIVIGYRDGAIRHPEGRDCRPG
jgi:hypothetical protein